MISILFGASFCAYASIFSQVTVYFFHQAHFKMINTAVQKTKSVTMGLVHHRLDVEDIRMVMFCDSSFLNNYDSSTQLGYVIILTDRTKRANWCHYASYKSKRIVKSVVCGETHAFADGFDIGFTLNHHTERIIWNMIPITTLTDS